MNLQKYLKLIQELLQLQNQNNTTYFLMQLQSEQKYEYIDKSITCSRDNDICVNTFIDKYNKTFTGYHNKDIMIDTIDYSVGYIVGVTLPFGIYLTTLIFLLIYCVK